MKKIAALALIIASTSVFATSTVGGLDSVQNVQSTSKQGFHGQIGLGAISLPEYMGSDTSETIGVPLINVSYNDTFYFKFNKLGGWFYKSDNGFRVGALLTRQAGIDKDDTLHYIHDREDTTMVGVNAVYKMGMFSAEVGFLKGLGDYDETDYGDSSDGGKFYAQAQYTIVARQEYTLTVSAKVENWDEDLVNYYYNNKNATTNATVSLIGTYKLTDKWTILGAVSGTSLGDEIADSGMVEDDTYNGILLGATYSF